MDRLKEGTARTPQARRYLPLFILMGSTGRRKEAILSLRWPQVDLVAKIIDFEIAARPPIRDAARYASPTGLLPPPSQGASAVASDIGYVIHEHGKRIGDIKKGFAAACARAGSRRV